MRWGRDSGTPVVAMPLRIRSATREPTADPPRLILRALDDLHALAQAAARLEDIERRSTSASPRSSSWARASTSALVQVLELGDRIVALGERGGRASASAPRRSSPPATASSSPRRTSRSSARQIADALPVLQRAITMAEPLEGAVERLGRIVDRLPGGMRARSGT